MTREELLGGLAGVGIAILGYLAGTLLFGSRPPSFGIVLVMVFAFGVGVGGVRHGNKRKGP